MTNVVKEKPKKSVLPMSTNGIRTYAYFQSISIRVGDGAIGLLQARFRALLVYGSTRDSEGISRRGSLADPD